MVAGNACGQVYRWNGQDAEAAPEVLDCRRFAQKPALDVWMRRGATAG